MGDQDLTPSEGRGWVESICGGTAGKAGEVQKEARTLRVFISYAKTPHYCHPVTTFWPWQGGSLPLTKLSLLNAFDSYKV